MYATFFDEHTDDVAVTLECGDRQGLSNQPALLVRRLLVACRLGASPGVRPHMEKIPHDLLVAFHRSKEQRRRPVGAMRIKFSLESPTLDKIMYPVDKPISGRVVERNHQRGTPIPIRQWREIWIFMPRTCIVEKFQSRPIFVIDWFV